jgi:adenylosuccinate lyase
MPSSRAASARLVAARKEIATCAISGAVGTFANIDPRVEEHVAKMMGLKPSRCRPRSSRATVMRCSSQRSASSPRRSSASRWKSATAAHGSAGSGGVFLAGPEGLVRHAAQAQSGADGKPHRPCAPGARCMAMPAMENVALWHERDISHSSVERMIGPDATVTLDFALNASPA